MAAGTFTLFRSNLDDMNPNDLIGASVMVALVSSSYTPDASNTGHDEWADVSAHEIANGNGYTTGGVALSNDTVNTATNGWMYDSDNPSWTASGGNIPAWRYAVMRVNGSLWGKTNPLIGYFLGDTAPADVPATSDGNPLTITAPAGGWFTVTQA